jgi:hypothetical protein
MLLRKRRQDLVRTQTTSDADSEESVVCNPSVQKAHQPAGRRAPIESRREVAFEAKHDPVRVEALSLKQPRLIMRRRRGAGVV